MEMIKVSGESVPGKVAGAIAASVREKGQATVQGVGAGAVNQAVKAIAITRGFLAPQGVDLVCVPGFVDVDIAGEERTAIRFVVRGETWASPAVAAVTFTSPKIKCPADAAEELKMVLPSLSEQV